MVAKLLDYRKMGINWKKPEVEKTGVEDKVIKGCAPHPFDWNQDHTGLYRLHLPRISFVVCLPTLFLSLTALSEQDLVGALIPRPVFPSHINQLISRKHTCECHVIQVNNLQSKNLPTHKIGRIIIIIIIIKNSINKLILPEYEFVNKIKCKILK